MNWFSLSKPLRAFGVLALLLAAFLSIASVPVAAQHDMSKMPGMSKPKVAPRKKKPRPRPRRPSTKKLVTPNASPSPTPSPSPAHEMMPGMQMPSASPSASPPHVMTPGMLMPSASPSPSPPHQMTPGMQMPTAPAVQPMQEPRPALRDDLPEGPVVSLEELERTALERNPTVSQAEASIRVSQGRRRQAGLYPNPIVGYFGEELSFRAMSQTSEHGVFVEQTIPLGGKLSKAKRVFARETEQAESIV